MSKRVPSESRRPGMVSHRRCSSCGVELASDASERCEDCRPHLSLIAKAASAATRKAKQELAIRERECRELERLIRRAEQAINDDDHGAEGHR